MDQAKETAGARPHVEADGIGRIAFDAGKSVAAARVQINARDGNGGAVTGDAAAGRDVKKWPLGCVARP